ncbi:peptidoglycan DD-metalloendopeptidase family protein [Zavarzinia sp.]|uniref:M23 family metallopeptidase n=1 Tax=Zavarzinia sp. TaxID=2027920 RepID=UPI0035641A29
MAPREIAIRDPWGVRWLRLSRRMQVSALALGLAGLAWVGHASLRTIFEQQLLEANAAELAQLRQDMAARDTEARRLRQQVAALEEERRIAFVSRQTIDKELALRTRERDEARITANRLLGEADAAAGARAAAATEAEQLSLELAHATIERWHGEESLQVAQDRIAILEGRSQGLRDQITQAERRATALKDQVATLELVQGQLVDRLMPVTTDQLTRLEGQLTPTGIDLDKIVSGSDGGSGGPMVDLDALAAAGPTEDSAKLLRLTSGIARLDALRAALPVMPLARPIEDYELRSGFGSRVDPINRRLAFHPGLDFAAPIGTPVMATAPGEVVEAGWAGAYGRSVRIRHAFGLQTRYAHLSAIDVHVGDKVDVGDVVGKLGSSGRSTGPHLHYEVMFDTVPRDPMPFIEAGSHVQQGQAEQPEGIAER